MRSKFMLGEILIEKGLTTQDDINKCLKEQKETGEPLGQVLVRMGCVKEDDLRVVLSEQLGMDFFKVDQLRPKMEQRLKELIPEDVAKEHTILPLEKDGGRLKIAAAMLPDVIFLDNLRKMTGHDIIVVLASESDLKGMIEQFYKGTTLQEVMTSSAFDDASTQYAKEGDEVKLDLESTISEADQAPVVRIVDLLLKKSLDDRASDIHIEPSDEKLTIRYRIDGTLYELPPPPRELHNAIVSRVKILSKLDIAEKRLPQDGSFSIRYEGRKIDVRVSTVPVVSGEKVVMRILDKRTELLDLKKLGFDSHQLEIFEEAIQKPYGLIFITGPTGSGKSTTLYSVLNRRKSTRVNIVTVEDPVEYQVDGINQVQVKPDIGLTFASGLRAFLRQDPDIILVGEVRDKDTADICIRASLTGHLVLSTLHTNDAPTAITRLVDIGIKPFLVSGSLQMVVAQRLIRSLCTNCKEAYTVDAKTKKDLGIKVDTLYKPKGCDECRNIGYWGRHAIYEVLPIDEDLRRLISANAAPDEIRKMQRAKGYQTLLMSGVKKVESGETSLDEVMAVAYE